MSVKLNLPTLLDLTSKNTTKIKINLCEFKFSPNAKPSGINSDKKHPIFGSCFCKGKKKVSRNFGLPLVRLKRGKKYQITFINETGYSFNIHWHGLNNPADVDGASTEVIFGKKTEIGPNLDIVIPNIDNNSAFLWFHAHPMFDSSPYGYSGVVGGLSVVDDASLKMQDYFKYPDNEIFLMYQEFEFNPDGTSNNQNLYTYPWRSCFGVINGQSCINWSNDDKKYISSLQHSCDNNLLRINFLNGAGSFRNIYLGVCDEDGNIKDFYYIMTDDGLRNPVPLNIVLISPASRASIIVDLNNFKNKKAFVFFYNYDLSEIFSLSTDKDNNLTATVPDFSNVSNGTPSPTPIPGPSSGISYPITPAIPTIQSLVPGGKLVKPSENFTIKKFLEVSYTGKSSQNIEKIISYIRSTVFQDPNNPILQKYINDPYLEYKIANEYNINYINLLNPNYFYNLPNTVNVPSRTFMLFFQGTYNYIGPKNNVIPVLAGPNQNVLIDKTYPPSSYQYNYISEGATEVAFNSQIYVDNWNSHEIDQEDAILSYFGNYKKNKLFSYKPDKLPTCLFKIFPYTKKNASYVNTFMLINDTLKIDIFSQDAQIQGMETSNIPPLQTVILTFEPTTDPINIKKLTEKINKKFQSTKVKIFGKEQLLSDILEYDWTYFPYNITPNFAQTGKNTKYINSVMLRTTNKTKYQIRVTGRWNLLDFFGKPMTPMYVSGGMMDHKSNKTSCCIGESNVKSCCSSKLDKSKKSCRCCPGCNCGDNCKCNADNKCSPDCKCGSKELDAIFKLKDMPMNLDAFIQQVFPFYPDPLNPYDVNNPMSGTTIRCYKDVLSYFIIAPFDETNEDRENNGVYKGFVDGFMNDNYMNFSVMKNSSEKWYYFNMDFQDSHPFHFHLTSGYLNLIGDKNSNNYYEKNPYSNALINPTNFYQPYTYSIDNYGIGVQQWISFFVKFANFSSEKGSMYDGKYANLGYMYHCHYFLHHDMSMMGQYYVYTNYDKFFK